MDYPYLTQDLPDLEPTSEWIQQDAKEPVQYIKNMQDGSAAGYKYFDFHNLRRISVQVRGKADGVIAIGTAKTDGSAGRIPVRLDTADWQELYGDVSIKDGIAVLYFTFQGEGQLDFRSFCLQRDTEL